jgi:hypothetical protein
MGILTPNLPKDSQAHGPGPAVAAGWRLPSVGGVAGAAAGDSPEIEGRANGR